MFYVFARTEASFSEVSRHETKEEAIAACPPWGRVEFLAGGRSEIIYDAPPE